MADGAPTVLEWLLAVGEGHFFNYAPPRHQRYDVELPLHYRASGEATWHEGRTANIGPTGVYFCADWLMAVDTQVEISFEILVGIDGEIVGEMVCQGEIVRMVLPATIDAQPGLAARILEYCFVCGQKAAAS